MASLDDSDIVADAEPEDYQPRYSVINKEVTPARSRNQSRSSVITQEETSAKLDNQARPYFLNQEERYVRPDKQTFLNQTDDEYEKYLDIFPPPLREDDTDILIISSENDEDQDKATQFKEFIEKTVRYTIPGKTMIPRVQLLRDSPVHSPYYLDEAARALYVFIFVTEEFCGERMNIQESFACLLESLKHKAKYGTVIPVYTSPELYKQDGLPYMLKSITPLNYFGRTDKVTLKIKELLMHKKDEIIKKMSVLHENRKDHWIKNEVEIKKMFGCVKPQNTGQKQNVKLPSSCDSTDSIPSVTVTLKEMKVAEMPTRILEEQSSQLLNFSAQVPARTYSQFGQRGYGEEKHLASSDALSNSQRSASINSGDTQRNREVPVGFAELSSPVSTRQPAEVSESAYVSYNDDKEQTYPKQL